MTTLADTSALVEFLRGTGSETGVRVRTLSGLSDELVITEPIEMELLAGARDLAHLERLEAFVASFELIAVEPARDYVAAAAVYRACRARGETVRQLTDCLIAAIAIRHDVPVLHHDRDFEVLARHTPMRVA